MNFRYYKGSEADQFSFIRIPKIMLTGTLFAELSLEAKVLYVYFERTLSIRWGNA